MKPIKRNFKDGDSQGISDQVLARIESEGVRPVPRWCWRCLNHGVWMLWALSVTVGAVAVAVMLYVANHARFALIEATHHTPLSFFIEVLPYVWVGVFIVMGILAYFNLRRTKRGYRYPVTHIMVSSVVFSIVGGIVLHTFGVGYTIDHRLTMGMPLYPSIEKKEETMWQNPTEGRLLGRWVGTENDHMMYDLVDQQGVTWSVTVHELREQDVMLLQSQKLVRLLGTTTDPSNHYFHACGVFPWMFTPEARSVDLAARRQEFVERMHEHMKTKERIRDRETASYSTVSEPGRFLSGLCADIPAVRRLQPATQ